MLENSAAKNLPLSVKKIINLLEKLNDTQRKSLFKHFESNKKDSKYIKLLDVLFELIVMEDIKLEKFTEESFYLLLLRKGVILHKDSQKRSMELSQLCSTITERVLNILRQNNQKENNQKIKLLELLQDISILYNLNCNY